MSGTVTHAARLRALVVAIAVPMILAAGFGALFWAKAVRTVATVDSPVRSSAVEVYPWPRPSADRSPIAPIGKEYYWRD